VRAILAEPEAVWAATEDHLFQADPARGVFDAVPDTVFGRGGPPAVRAMLMDRTEGGPAFPTLATFRGTYEALLDGGSFFLRNYGTGNTFFITLLVPLIPMVVTYSSCLSDSPPS
jgi:hypothetical protein